MHSRLRASASSRSNLIGIATLVILGLTFLNLFNSPQAAGAPPAIRAGTSSAAPSAAEGLCASWFPARQQIPTDHPKRTSIEQDYQNCVTARQTPLPPVHAKTLPSTVQSAGLGNVARRAVGDGTLIENGLSPLPAMAYVIVNSWYRELRNKRLLVYAGARRDDLGASSSPTQGVVIVMVETLEGQPVPDEGGEYETPTAVGAVRIVDGSGMQLTLVAEDGTGFFFDVASRRFVTPGPK